MRTLVTFVDDTVLDSHSDPQTPNNSIIEPINNIKIESKLGLIEGGKSEPTKQNQCNQRSVCEETLGPSVQSNAETRQQYRQRC